MRPSRLAAALVAAPVLGLAACGSAPRDLETPRWPTPRRGMVVSEHPLATRVGLDVLDDGGNAADAAVAMALALAVVYPQAGNLGGGGFALWVAHDPHAPPRALDFRETAPRALRAADFQRDGQRDPELALESALSAGVPGSPYGLWAFQREFGSLPFAEVVAPAIELARGGFTVDAWLARDLARAENRRKLERDPDAAALFLPGGAPLAEGARLRQVVLASTLETYAREGPEAFRTGALAEAIARCCERKGGRIDGVDLAAYSPIWREPLRGWFRGYEVITMPPPSAGGIALLQVLAILDGFPLDAERESALAGAAARREIGAEVGPQASAGLSVRALHWWIEAMRCAFADRAEHAGDPAFHDVPVADLLAPEWVAARRVSIGERAQAGVAAWTPPPEGRETTHLCAIDEAGNAVSLTTTLNEAFGCGVLVEGGGFLLNDEMDDFALQPGAPNGSGLVSGAANALAGGKRPVSSMTPTVLRDNGNTVALVIGSPGGPRIPTALAQVLLRLFVYAQPLEEAVAAPRIHQQGSPLRTEFEPGWDGELVQGLRHRDHEAQEVGRAWASVQAIWVPPGGEPMGCSDPRRGGAAAAQGRPFPPARRPNPLP